MLLNHRLWLPIGLLWLNLGAIVGCRPTEAPPPVAGELFAVAESDDSKDVAVEREEWTIADTPREFSFPTDHGSHEDYRIEWWYYTGNLTAPNGRQFGYQLTFFRTGVHREPQTASRWAVRHIYTAHFAISDIKRGRHVQAQRNNRGALGQAGAQSDELKVWNGNWQVVADGEVHVLTAEHEGNLLELRLTPAKPPTAHGETALSQKGAAAGNASYYYSFTNMSTVGRLTCDGKTWDVTGKSWMDHEFSTSFLEPGQQGWDWFAIQLDDNSELMLYRMRRDDGTADSYSSGTYVDPAGRVIRLTSSDFELVPQSFWTSPVTGGSYPLAWQVNVPKLNCQLRVNRAMDDQEMRTTDTTGITYWEGAIVVQGQLQGKPAKGVGYLELTGYSGRGLGSVF